MSKPAVAAHDTSKQRLRLWLRLLAATRATEAEIRERLRHEFATTLPRFDVMAAAFREPDGLTMTQLSRRLMVSNGNVTGIVDRLVKDGLILRATEAHDRRAYRIALTAAGRVEFARMAAAHERWIGELLGGIDGAEASRLMATLDRLRAGKEAVS